MSLEELRRIRNRRMEKQYTVLQEHRRQVDACQRNLNQAHEALKQFQQWRLQQQDAHFRDLQSKTFSPETMREYQAQVERLRQEEEMHKQKIPECENKLKAAQDAFDTCKRKSNELTLKHEKLKEIIEIRDKETAQTEDEG